MNTSEIEERIDSINALTDPLLKEKWELTHLLDRTKSKEFIRVNGIKKIDVQTSDDEDLPWFGYIGDFGRWLENNTDKEWCCWNGTIYMTSEIIAGRMSYDPCAFYEDLEE